MGNNESLPPPPPPGFNPPPPQQPQQPQYAPPPGQYTPPPQQFPPQYAPQQYPPAMPPAAPKKKTGLIIAGVVVVAAIIVGVVVATGGDDKKKTTLGSDDSVLSTDETSPSDDTLVITVPNSTGSSTDDTVPGEDGMTTVKDDTGTFVALIPEGWEFDTRPITGKATIAQVKGSPVMDEFNSGDDGAGFAIVVAKPEQQLSAQAMLNGLSPKAGVCTTQIDTDPPQDTLFGPAIVRRFDGCGSAGGAGKVIMAVTDSTTGDTIGLYIQGASPSESTLVPLAIVLLITLQLS